MSKPRIAIVVPAHNEAASLPDVIASLTNVRRRRDDWEWLIVIVDDGSTDETSAVLAELRKAHVFTVVVCPINVGIGAAVQAGFQYAVTWQPDVTLQFDGDGQHPVEAIVALVEPVLSGKSDVVVGSRYLPGAGGTVSSGLRRFGTALLSWLLRLLVGVRVKDVTSGFRAFSREASEYISRYYPDDYPEVEAYVPLARSRFRIQELPVQMKPRTGGKSSISALGGAYYMLKVTLAVFIHLIKRIPERRSIGRDT